MEITINLTNTHKIQNTIDALERALHHKPRHVIDDTIFIDVIAIFRQIQERSKNFSSSPVGYCSDRFIIQSGAGYLAQLHPDFPMTSEKEDAVLLTMDSAVNLLKIFNSKGLQASMELA